ncbi:VanZ family protein [Virgibacillus phasianinus]|uniref:VanZ family protein n=1 Tax=Virgibacillus phasianinus TaxID=2017483 RepID=A0A220U4R1_9BACI|nr:VanZ family protein [Virgibacillus phasianinus]ASK62713.1 VanZ family protein [Virgibacillus phasianinus]
MTKINYWLLPIGWMGLIFYSSATPYQDQDIKPFMTNKLDLSFLVPFVENVTLYYHHSEVSVDALGIEGFVEFFVRKGAHVSVYFILMVLFYVACKKTMSVSSSKRLLLSYIFTSLYAILDELHQGFTQNRTPYIGDVGLDMSGALAALILIILFAAFKKKSIAKNTFS